MMIEPSAGRITRVYRTATGDQLAHGLDWYRAARSAAAGLDPRNVERAAGVIAALSPRVSWKRNLLLAELTYETGVASGALGRSCRDANAIFRGADPLTVLGGPKVRAFYQLIVNPDDELTVCVDRHAIDVAVGARNSEADRSKLYQLHRGGRYEQFAACYRQAATLLGVRPAQVQAVTWVTWRDRLRAAPA